MDSNKKHNKLTEIAEEINDYIGFIIELKSICTKVNIECTNSATVNFRDALTHYKIMYETEVENELQMQYNFIVEHLNRGAKDSFVYLIQEHLRKLTFMQDDNLFIIQYSKLDINDQKQFRKTIHRMKNIIISLRIDSIGLVRMLDKIEIIQEELLDVFMSLHDILLKMNIWHKYCEIKVTRDVSIS